MKYNPVTEIDIDINSGSCKSGPALDLEDIADMMPVKKEGGVRPNRTRQPQEMISEKLRAALTKQGYHLVGSHSGVKLCRWTKNQLRGRGGCYKHTFYGIESHRCMGKALQISYFLYKCQNDRRQYFSLRSFFLILSNCYFD
jgi:hypothetical protein